MLTMARLRLALLSLILTLPGLVRAADGSPLAWGPYVEFPTPDSARVYWNTRDAVPTRLDVRVGAAAGGL